jgi:hypothetical protein
MKTCVQGLCMVPVSGIAVISGNSTSPLVTRCHQMRLITGSHCRCLNSCCLLPRRRGVSRRMVFWRYVGLLGDFLALAMLASWMNNQRLIRNVGDHLALYHHLTGTPVEPKPVLSSACAPMAHCWMTGSVGVSHCVIAWAVSGAAPGACR